MVLHVLGSSDAQAPVREFMHQMRRGMPLNKEIDSHHWVDGMNELQIRERDHLSNDELVAQLRAVGPKAVKGRWRTPPPARYLPIPFGAPIGWAPLKYLLDVGFTRDMWAHRIDIHHPEETSQWNWRRPEPRSRSTPTRLGLSAATRSSRHPPPMHRRLGAVHVNRPARDP